MSDTYETAAGYEDKTLPVIVYVLYFLGLFHGLTMIIGLIIAYVSRDTAGPRMASHYTWLIRTFWTTLAGMVLGLLVIGVGIPLSVILIGVPIMMAGGLICAAAWVVCLIRLIVGVTHVARDEAYPRPYAVVA
jgi:uncharacterized membrane protein